MVDGNPVFIRSSVVCHPQRRPMGGVGAPPFSSRHSLQVSLAVNLKIRGEKEKGVLRAVKSEPVCEPSPPEGKQTPWNYPGRSTGSWPGRGLWVPPCRPGVSQRLSRPCPLLVKRIPASPHVTPLHHSASLCSVTSRHSTVSLTSLHCVTRVTSRHSKRH